MRFWTLLPLVVILAEPSSALEGPIGCSRDERGGTSLLYPEEGSSATNSTLVTICVAENAAPWVSRRSPKKGAHPGPADGVSVMPLLHFFEEFHGFDVELLNAIRMWAPTDEFHLFVSCMFAYCACMKFHKTTILIIGR